jgi:formylglycine-generating enzyme required for sulfatase activity/ribosomal protein L12E/L44/L45/RPP1/RPP2
VAKPINAMVRQSEFEVAGNVESDTFRAFEGNRRQEITFKGAAMGKESTLPQVRKSILAYNQAANAVRYSLPGEEAAVKSSIIRIVIVVWLLGWVQAVSAAEGNWQKDPRRSPFGCNGSCDHAAGKARMHGISGEAPGAPQQAAAAVKPEPLTSQQLLELVNAHLTNQRIEELIKARGIDFLVDDNYVKTLRRAGANDQLIALLREASKKSAEVAVGTAPNAQVFLDGNLQGQANAQGELEFLTSRGAHTLKVTLAGKQDFEQSLTLEGGQPTRIVAPLVDLAGSLKVKAPSGAVIWLDNSVRGTVDASGELLLNDIPAGAHPLRATAQGKVDESLNITIAAGAETPVTVALAEAVQVNPQDGLKYVWIAPGTFSMGCSPGDADCADSEKPAHPVTLSNAFWIGQTEVTVAAYKRYVQTAKGKMPPVAPKPYHGWSTGSLPMVNVVWDEANQYCTWADGRLPTEAEWEYAARGGSPQARYGDLKAIAWFKDNAGNRTHEVAAKLPNGLGLYDTLGNVWEWVGDWFDPNYYQSGAAQDPNGPATGQAKVLRGGAWIVDTKLIRVSDRYSYKPDARSEFFGFRCVWQPKTP